MLVDLVFSWTTPILALTIYGLFRYFWPKYTKNTNHINWKPFETICITLAIYLVTQLLTALIIYSIGSIFGFDDKQIKNWLDNATLGQFSLILAVELLTFGALYWFLKRRQSSLKFIGLNRKPAFKDLGLAALGFLAYFGMLLIATGLFERVFPNVNKDQHQIVGFDNAAGGQLILVFISLVILPPIIEELLVRGFLFSGLKKSWPIVWAYLGTSFIFALPHLQAGNGEPLLWTAAIDTFVLSLVLIYLRQSTGSLWASIMLHMLKNGMAFMVLFVFHLG